MAEISKDEIIDAQLVEAEELQDESDFSTSENLSLDDLMNVRLTVTADLGHAPMKVRDVIALKEGSIVTLNKMAGELTDIYVNGLPLAKGEVVVINDTLHVRMSEILNTLEILERGYG